MAASSRLNFCSVEIYDDQVLGVGSYGKVCKAKYGQLSCAAKLLHDTMFEGGDPGIFKFVKKFEQECQFLSMIKHPNIVQFLKTYTKPQSQRLALLMELMDESLTRLLERSNTILPYHIQLNICHDVALALSYLHSNDIIHRDLSSNNVLLIGEGSRAKVTDFGMSKLMDMNPCMTPLTVCPGATVYMPPEALTTPPHYSSKLDCFSHGVLTIQILTSNFPKPGDAHQSANDLNYPTGEILIKVPEIERRKRDIDMVDPNHPLLPLALHCLHNKDSERPSADEVCERLATLKKEEMYTHSVEQTRDQAALIQTLQGELEQKEQVILQERASHDREIQNQASVVQALRGELVKKEQVIHQKLTELTQEKNLTFSLQTHLYEYAVQLQKEKDDRKRILEEKEKLSEGIFEKRHGSLRGRNAATGEDLAKKVSEWNKWKPAPENLNFGPSTSLVDGNTAYFSHDNNIYSFSILDNEWTKLPPCPYKWFAMAVIDDKLTTIGGRESFFTGTNALLSIDTGRWWKHIPPMPTERSSPAAVTTPKHLIVAGGRTGEFSCTNVVEVLDKSTLQWSTASSLPEGSLSPQMTLCGKHIYFASNAAVMSCCTEELLKSCAHNDSDGNSVWATLANIPEPFDASLVSVREQVLAMGGRNEYGMNTTPAIRWYDEDTDSWCAIGELPVPLSNALVAVLPSNQLIVVGGYGDDGKSSCQTYINIVPL